MSSRLNLEQLESQTESGAPKTTATVESLEPEPVVAPQIFERRLVSKPKENKSLYLIPLVVLLISFGLGKVFIRPVVVAVEPVAEVEEAPVEETDEYAGLPKTEICPLNGLLYSVPERELWETRRPLAVMIENAPEARPQSGLSNADIVFELVAEGGITRFMAMFYCDAQRDDVLLAPIRSARTYYVNLASGFNRPLYVHVGGANDESTPQTHALSQLGQYGWNLENDINQFTVSYPTFVRDVNRIKGVELATEHTMTTSTEKLWTFAANKRGWTNMSPEIIIGRTTIPAADWQDGYTGWSFDDSKPQGTAKRIAYEFWSGQPIFDVVWNYDEGSGTYWRSNGGEVQIDLNTDAPLAYTNVIVLYAKETGPLNEVKHMMYEVIGSGDALAFAGGEVTEIKWSKKDREAELVFKDKAGADFVMPRGKVWISVVDTTNKSVTY